MKKILIKTLFITLFMLLMIILYFNDIIIANTIQNTGISKLMQLKMATMFLSTEDSPLLRGYPGDIISLISATSVPNPIMPGVGGKISFELKINEQCTAQDTKIEILDPSGQTVFYGGVFDTSTGEWKCENASRTAAEKMTFDLIVPSSVVPGTYIVKFYYDGYSSFTYNIVVGSSPTTINVTSVRLDQSSKTLEIGEDFTLIPTVNPQNATNQNVSWSSSNTSVATVSNGKVTAIGKGTTTITVTTEDGALTATCTITVTEHEDPPTPVAVTGISLSETSKTLEIGEDFTLIPTITPGNATNKNVSWSSNSTSVATVSNGKVTAVGKGTATITVKTDDGNFTATCIVTVNEPVSRVTGVSLSETSKTLEIGEDFTLTPTITPGDATNTNVSWSSNSTSVATVSNGKVTAVGEGTATITVKTDDGDFTATCTVTVIDIEPSITSSEYEMVDENKIIVPHDTGVKKFMNNIEVNGNFTPEIYDQNNNKLEDDAIIGTGMTLRINGVVLYIFIVPGDLDGDGLVTVVDLSKIKLHLLDLNTLEGVYESAAYLKSGSGDIDITDLAIIKLIIIGLK